MVSASAKRRDRSSSPRPDSEAVPFGGVGVDTGTGPASPWAGRGCANPRSGVEGSAGQGSGGGGALTPVPPCGTQSLHNPHESRSKRTQASRLAHAHTRRPNRMRCGDGVSTGRVCLGVTSRSATAGCCDRQHSLSTRQRRSGDLRLTFWRMATVSHQQALYLSPRHGALEYAGVGVRSKRWQPVRRARHRK